MSTIVTMSQTVGPLTSGQTYRVRTRNAELLAAAGQATKSPDRGSKANIPVTREGK